MSNDILPNGAIRKNTGVPAPIRFSIWKPPHDHCASKMVTIHYTPNDFEELGLSFRRVFRAGIRSPASSHQSYRPSIPVCGRVDPVHDLKLPARGFQRSVNALLVPAHSADAGENAAELTRRIKAAVIAVF
ncbi:unnamed protein product [Nesidiocoris tenuis]|uniref:Uncharacterized protein n=1 Tax=Nesidiocoris tenuis TaxID=355587 RepID=A0A6H5HNW4_9HEMI|nr:unnamed protein product [Nesidiocoris tenuis]